MTLAWERVREYSDIEYEKAECIAMLTINRPAVRNAFRPQTVMQLIAALIDAQLASQLGAGAGGGQLHCAFFQLQPPWPGLKGFAPFGLRQRHCCRFAPRSWHLSLSANWGPRCAQLQQSA